MNLIRISIKWLDNVSTVISFEEKSYVYFMVGFNQHYARGEIKFVNLNWHGMCN
jgi:hypothetical protein